jgi:AraC-like DNA-binding protein
MAAILRYVEAGFEYQLEGVDDQPSVLRERLHEITALPLEAAVMAILADGLARSSESLKRAVRRLFLRPEDFPSVRELHRAACTSRRSLDRMLQRSELPPAHDLLIAARYLRAYIYARQPRHDLKFVAAKLGMARPWALTRLVRMVAGRTPRAWRKSFNDQSVLEDLMRWLGRHAEGERADEPADELEDAAAD